MVAIHMPFPCFTAPSTSPFTDQNTPLEQCDNRRSGGASRGNGQISEFGAIPARYQPLNLSAPSTALSIYRCYQSKGSHAESSKTGTSDWVADEGILQSDSRHLTAGLWNEIHRNLFRVLATGLLQR
jgi:hypothetical protein